MAEVVETAIATSQHATIEAGTGTGKTLAYAIPAILSGKRTVVSTATLGLQSQLINKDLPFLTEELGKRGITFTTALAKGRGNFVCREAVDAALTDQFSSSKPSAELLQLGLDSTRGGSGEKSELDVVPSDWPSYSAENCIGKGCKHVESCAYRIARAAAQSAQITVANHALVGADISLTNSRTKNPLLGPYDVLILDEAHKAVDYFRGAFAKSAYESTPNQVHKALSKHINNLDQAAADKMKSCAAEIFKALPTPFREPYSLLSTEPIPALIVASSSFEIAHQRYILGPAQLLREYETQLATRSLSSGEFRQMSLLRRQLGRLKDFCDLVVTAASNPSQNWINYTVLDGGAKKLIGTPVSVVPMLKTALYPNLKSVIATSATISVAKTFDSLKEELGIESPKELEAVLASPFNYMTSAVMYLPGHIPEAPSDKDLSGLLNYGRIIADEVEQLTALTQGRAFVLFTSRAELDAVHQHLMTRRLNLLKQDETTTAQALLARYHADVAADRAPILLGLKSFWEGVSVEGDDLSMVIVVKLPFPNRSDPIYNALCTAAGDEWFSKVALPQMIRELKQGVGRLIRTADDVGIVALLDRRMHTKGYASKILHSLPFTNRTTQLGEVKKRYQQMLQLRNSRGGGAVVK